VSAGGRGRSRRGAHAEEHENHERWLVSYADMITVLMALFIVLFAISQVDQQKFVQLKSGLAEGFGASSAIPIEGGTGMLSSNGSVPNPAQLEVDAAPAPVDLIDSGDTGENSARAAQARLDAAEAELDRLVEIQAALEAALDDKGLGDQVRFRITERGLVAAVVADDVFFASASARIQPRGLEVLDVMAPVLAGLPEQIAVEGNANHLPITGGSYATNWELSSARATAVVRHLIDRGRMAPDRLSATGYGDTRPLFPVHDPQAVTGNRRVDLVVLDQQPAAVRDLIPQLAEARGLSTDAHPVGDDDGGH
jgi:chemotaxis protein MotB